WQGSAAEPRADLLERARLEDPAGTAAADEAARAGGAHGRDEGIEGLVRMDRADDADEQLAARAGPVRRRRHDERNPALHQDPYQRGELRIEHAAGDQLDEGWCGGRRCGHGSEPSRWPGPGQESTAPA